jgi:hypothetical protein
LWQQAGTYPAGTDRGLLSTLWPASGSTGGAVTTVANTMTTSVAPGTAAVALTTAGALTQLCRWDAAEVVTHAAAPPAGSSRIDLVVLQVRDNTLDAGGNNDFIFQAIAGAGGTPGPGAAPAVPTNAYAMGQLTVPGGAANLNGVTVVDRRVPLAVSAASVHSRVRRVAAWTAANGAQFSFDTVDYGAAYATAAGLFTCPLAGYYLVNANLSVVTTGANQWLRALVYRNGAGAYANGPFIVAPATALAASAPVTTVVQANGGDTLAIWTTTSTVGLAGQTTADTQAWASFDYLGG